MTFETQFLLRGAVENRPVALLIDGARGIWRRIVPDSFDYPVRVVPRLRRLLSLVPLEGRLLCDSCFAALFGAEFADPRLIVRDSVGPENPREVGEVVGRLGHVSDDLTYLRFVPQLGLSGALDRVVSIAAQGVLRSFAGRLPGFSWSSLPYLFANFLDLPATLEEQSERRVVLLGRPPLGVILTMTGLFRRSYRLAWLDDRPILLFPEP